MPHCPCTPQTSAAAGGTMAACPLPLSFLRPGSCGIVHSIKAEGILGSRLRDMGIIPGVALEVTGLAPLGDPMSVSLGGYELSLRSAEAGEIWVRTNPDTGCEQDEQGKQGKMGSTTSAGSKA